MPAGEPAQLTIEVPGRDPIPDNVSVSAFPSGQPPIPFVGGDGFVHPQTRLERIATFESRRADMSLGRPGRYTIHFVREGRVLGEPIERELKRGANRIANR